MTFLSDIFTKNSKKILAINRSQEAVKLLPRRSPEAYRPGSAFCQEFQELISSGWRFGDVFKGVFHQAGDHAGSIGVAADEFTKVTQSEFLGRLDVVSPREYV